MCGIVGIISSSGKDNLLKERDILIGMRDSLTHRGPDDEGVYLDEKVFLGHRRLSIIDLEGGKQPMTNEDGNLVIVYNGEVYNFLELRKELEAKGHVFKTRSDTEVILHSFEEFGASCVKRFIGMFAFAIWDKKNKTLFMARDHFGIKPLYYTVVNNKMIFASELKAILRYPEISKRIDKSAMTQYFMFEYVPDPLSIFEGIKKLEPACRLIYKDKNISIDKYWDIKINPVKYQNEAEVRERLLYLLRRSVSRMMRSDVPIGVLLSGGLDSSTIFALMNEVLPGGIRTFTIGFEEISFDESDYARMLAKHFMSYHHEFRIRPHQLIDYIPKVVRALDEPFGDSGVVITHFLHTMTSRHVKVALSGEGGDELFAGYQHIIAHKAAEFIGRLPSCMLEKVLKPAVNRLPVAYDYFSFEFKAKKFISGLNYDPLERNQVWLGSYSPAQQKMLFSPEMYRQVAKLNIFDPIYKATKDVKVNDIISRILLADFKLYLPGDILTLADRASMATSLEARLPFLDQELVEFVISLPADMKLKGFLSKYILRKTMAPILPETITKRKKIGLNIPASKWIREQLKDFVKETLSPSFIKRQQMFEYKYIDRLLEEHFKGVRDNRKQIWTLLMFELWYKEYIEK